MDKLKVNIDGQTFEVNASDISFEGYALIESKDLQKFKSYAVEAELMRVGTGMKFHHAFITGIGGTAPVITKLEGDKFAADDEGNVYRSDGAKFLTDGKGRITVERYYQENPKILTKLQKGIRAYYGT